MAMMSDERAKIIAKAEADGGAVPAPLKWSQALEVLKLVERLYGGTIYEWDWCAHNVTLFQDLVNRFLLRQEELAEDYDKQWGGWNDAGIAEMRGLAVADLEAWHYALE